MGGSSMSLVAQLVSQQQVAVHYVFTQVVPPHGPCCTTWPTLHHMLHVQQAALHQAVGRAAARWAHLHVRWSACACAMHLQVHVSVNDRTLSRVLVMV